MQFIIAIYGINVDCFWVLFRWVSKAPLNDKLILIEHFHINRHNSPQATSYYILDLCLSGQNERLKTNIGGCGRSVFGRGAKPQACMIGFFPVFGTHLISQIDKVEIFWCLFY